MVKKRPERRLKRLLNVVRLLTSDGPSASQLQLPNYRNLYFVGGVPKDGVRARGEISRTRPEGFEVTQTSAVRPCVAALTTTDNWTTGQLVVVQRTNVWC